MAITLKKIGTIIHFYDKINVAIIALTDNLQVGDKVRFSRGGEDLFDQDVTSLQIDHKEVQKAESGDEVGLKTDQILKDATDVFQIEQEA